MKNFALYMHERNFVVFGSRLYEVPNKNKMKLKNSKTLSFVADL